MAVTQNHHSKHIPRTGFILALILLQLFAPALPARAARGLPGSPEFGFGARLDIWGAELELAIKTATAIGLDWIAVDFDWGRLWNTEFASLDLDRLDQVIQLAGQRGLGILISITNPPEWARTEAGPDPNSTLALLSTLSQRYLPYQLAIELFPAANTRLGWGAAPNPQAYADLLRQAQQTILSSNPAITLVAGGLSPVPPQDQSGDMDDLQFLNALYQAGAASFLPVIGLRLTIMNADALSLAEQGDYRVLRHYEDIRQVMVANGHTQGLIWITCFHWPESLIALPITNSAEQVRWLSQAVQMMKSQLYLGVAFFDRLNPPADSGPGELAGASLILRQSGRVYLHPAVKALGRIITMLRTGQNTAFDLYLDKKLVTGPAKGLMKSSQP